MPTLRTRSSTPFTNRDVTRGEYEARELADAPRIDVMAEHQDVVVVAPASFLPVAFRAYRECTV